MTLFGHFLFAMICVALARLGLGLNENLKAVEGSSKSEIMKQQRNVGYLNNSYPNYWEGSLDTKPLDKKHERNFSFWATTMSGSGSFKPEDEEEFLKIMENNFATFGEDLLSGCLETDDVEELLRHEKAEINRKLLRFFFLNFILFLVSISLSIYAVVQSRKNILGRNLSRKAVFRYKKSFVNESETIASEQNMENDSTFPIDQTSLTSNSLRSRNGSSQAYTVAV